MLQLKNNKGLTDKRANRQMKEHRTLKEDSFYGTQKRPLAAMIQCSSNCGCKILGMILLQIFLQNCSLMGGVIP